MPWRRLVVCVFGVGMCERTQAELFVNTYSGRFFSSAGLFSFDVFDGPQVRLRRSLLGEQPTAERVLARLSRRVH